MKGSNMGGLRMQKKNAMGGGANCAPTLPAGGGAAALGLKKGGKVKAKKETKKKKGK